MQGTASTANFWHAQTIQGVDTPGISIKQNTLLSTPPGLSKIGWYTFVAVRHFESQSRIFQNVDPRLWARLPIILCANCWTCIIIVV